MIRAAIVTGMLLALSACSSAPMRDLQQLRWTSKGEAAFATGMQEYENAQYVESARHLQAAVNLGLADAQRARAHKHLAFIHCASGRERLCREDFRKALAVEPKMDLTAAEAGHPVWGPIFRSMKEEPRGGPAALAKADASVQVVKGGAAPGKGEPALVAGLRLYEEGSYDASARNLQEALAQGVANPERVKAHKHLAFIHCAADRQQPCREEFRKALAIDPALELAPAEAGHPAWGPVFRAVKAGR